MKYRVTTIAMLLLAFFLKDAVTLVLVTGEMASAELSASGPLAAPLMLPVVSAVPLAALEAVPTGQAEGMGPPTCHAAPFSDPQTPLPEIGGSSQRVTTLGASGASGLEAILLGSILLSISSLLARRRGSWRRLVGFVPAVAIPPG